MQDLTDNLVTGTLAMGAQGAKPVATESSKVQPLTSAASFSEELGSAVESAVDGEYFVQLEALVPTSDLESGLEYVGTSGQMVAYSGEAFPHEGQDFSALTEVLPLSDQVKVQVHDLQSEEVTNSLGQSSALVDMESVSDQQELVIPGQTFVDMKSTDSKLSQSAALSGALNGTLGGGTQQQLRGQLQQPTMNVSAEQRANISATISEDLPLTVEELSPVTNSTKSLEAMLKVGSQAGSDIKLTTNDLALSLQNVSAPRAGVGVGDQSATLAGVMQQQSIEKPVTVPEIKTAMHDPSWKSDLGDRVAWMAKNKIPAAEIKINPAQLGPIEIKVTVNNDQASVTMIANHGTTREALEAAIPRLREILSDSGLQLADTDVSSQHSNSEQEDRQGDEFAETMGDTQQEEQQSDEEVEEGLITSLTNVTSDTGVNLFA